MKAVIDDFQELIHLYNIGWDSFTKLRKDLDLT